MTREKPAIKFDGDMKPAIDAWFAAAREAADQGKSEAEWVFAGDMALLNYVVKAEAQGDE